MPKFAGIPVDSAEAAKKPRFAGIPVDAAASADGGPAVPDAPPAGAVPGSGEYAKWAMGRVKAGLPVPQVSPKPPEAQDPNTDLGAKAIALSSSMINGVPVIGGELLKGAENLRSAVQGMPLEDVQKEGRAVREANPVTSAVGGITGSALSLAPLGATQIGGRLLGTVGSLGQRIGAGVVSGGALSGADTAARGGDAGEIFTNTILGGALGAALPAAGAALGRVGKGMAQNAATKAAIAGAPGADELKTVARGLFKQVDEAGVVVEPSALATEVADLVKEVKGMRINKVLDPKATASYRELIAATQEALNGKPLSFGDLHNLRQIAQKAATSSEGRDQMFSQKIVDMLDNFVTNPAAAVTSDGPATGQMLKDAISTWGRARRVDLIEQAIERAKNVASGFENGLRIEFRKLLQNKRTSSLFTDIERQEIERVVRGTTGTNLMKLIGKFGFGGGNASNMLGGSIGTSVGASLGSSLGPLGSLAGAALTGGGATAARKGAEKLTQKAAERAAKVVATPNIPIVEGRALTNGVVAPALLPLNVLRKREPIDITIKGGAG